MYEHGMRIHVLQVIRPIMFETHNHTKGPPLAETRAIAQDTVHFLRQCEEVHALACRAMVHVQELMAHKYKKRRRMSSNFWRKGFWFALTCLCSLYMLLKTLLIFHNSK